jgi:hypothetical protein
MQGRRLVLHNLAWFSYTKPHPGARDRGANAGGLADRRAITSFGSNTSRRMATIRTNKHNAVHELGKPGRTALIA